jgi:hypothetical protein
VTFAECLYRLFYRGAEAPSVWARALDVAERDLRRWVRGGAPVPPPAALAALYGRLAKAPVDAEVRRELEAWLARPVAAALGRAPRDHADAELTLAHYLTFAARAAALRALARLPPAEHAAFWQETERWARERTAAASP